MLLTIDALQSIFTKEVLEASTYSNKRGRYIRLINSRPQDATVPALYPNLSEYKRHLNKFENVKALRIDYIKGQGIDTGNKKTDLYLDYIDIQKPEIQLPSLNESN